MTLTQKIAIITGAAGGIGFGIAKRFVASGAFFDFEFKKCNCPKVDTRKA